MYADRRNSRVLQEIWVEQHEGWTVTSDFRPEVESSRFAIVLLAKCHTAAQHDVVHFDRQTARRYCRLVHLVPAVWLQAVATDG